MLLKFFNRRSFFVAVIFVIKSEGSNQDEDYLKV